MRIKFYIGRFQRFLVLWSAKRDDCNRLRLQTQSVLATDQRTVYGVGGCVRYFYRWLPFHHIHRYYLLFLPAGMSPPSSPPLSSSSSDMSESDSYGLEVSISETPALLDDAIPLPDCCCGGLPVFIVDARVLTGLQGTYSGCSLLSSIPVKMVGVLALFADFFLTRQKPGLPTRPRGELELTLPFLPIVWDKTRGLKHFTGDVKKRNSAEHKNTCCC